MHTYVRTNQYANVSNVHKGISLTLSSNLKSNFNIARNIIYVQAATLIGGHERSEVTKTQAPTGKIFSLSYHIESLKIGTVSYAP